MSVTDSFDTLADTEFAVDVFTVFGAFLAPTVASGAADRIAPNYNARVPREFYGIAEVAAAEMALDGSMKTHVQIGGGLYTVDKFAERMGIKGRIEEAVQA